MRQVVSVELPAPPLPPRWNLADEMKPFGGVPASEQLLRQARRAEYLGDASTAYSLYLTLFAASDSAEHLLCAARVQLRRTSALGHEVHRVLREQAARRRLAELLVVARCLLCAASFLLWHSA